MELKKLIKILINSASSISRQGKGCLFVISINPVRYKLMFDKSIKPFNISDKRKSDLLEFIGTKDGAVIVDKNGNIIDYGANIRMRVVMKGYGTRHSAGLSASLHKNISILASEQEKRVKLFKDGKLIAEYNPFKKGIEKAIPKSLSIMESLGWGTIGTLSLPLIGITGISIGSGIVIFTGIAHLIKYLNLNHNHFSNSSRAEAVSEQVGGLK